jgi:hypothetical protein
VAEPLVRQERQRTAVGRASGRERCRRDQEGRDEAAGQQHHAHHKCRRAQQFLGVANPPGRRRFGIGAVASHQRHDRDAGFKTRQTERELGKEQQRHRGHHQRVAMLLEQ